MRRVQAWERGQLQQIFCEAALPLILNEQNCPMKETLQEIDALRESGVIGQSAIGGAMGPPFTWSQSPPVIWTSSSCSNPRRWTGL
jgi:hypothetical protein